MKRYWPACLFLLLSLFTGIVSSDSAIKKEPALLHIGAFSESPLSDITPKGWQAFLIPGIDKKTAYYLNKDQDRTVVTAVSHASASGYYREVDIDPSAYPIVRWSWKIDDIIRSADISSKQGDDYPARIYVSFDYDLDKLSGMEWFKYKLYSILYDDPLPLAVINYVWDNNAAIGTMGSNAYTERVKMIVVESGTQHLKQWRQQERNIYEDYKKVFGGEPKNITGIAIMTDTDNTGESVTAYYGDIYFLMKDK